jgi:predicted Zn-dependent protease
VIELTSLDEIVERADRLVALSPADATSIAWVESREGEALESARQRRGGVENRRSVLFRVRVGGRTGRARAESALPNELQRSLRAALADARCAAPSPDWSLEAAQREPASLEGLFDPAVAALDPAAEQKELQRLGERRSTLRLRWRENRVAVAASFHLTRATTLTDVTFEARTGRRPGSGFAARSARRRDALDLPAIVAAARALEAPAVDPSAPEDVGRLLLAPEATAVLLDALARRALCGGRRLAGGKAPDLRLDPAVRLVDEPLDPRGLALPFDLDGCAKRPRVFVERGWVVGLAADLDLAARLGLEPTAHALAGDDAWPDHLTLEAGEADEPALRIAAGGGLRLGALEELAVEPGEAMPFRAVARNVRRVGVDGELGEGLAPLLWHGTLRDLFAEILASGRETVTWSPRGGSTGAVRCPALALAAPGRFAVRRR